MQQNQNLYEFIDKTLFFPEQGILVIGDLHIGYEQALIESGILLPERQIADIIEDLKKIINEIKNRKQKIKKVVFIGDIKHFFGYEWKEKANFSKVLEFLKTKVSERNIILIKGNHDTMELGLHFKEYHIEDNIAFVHGHKIHLEVFNKKVDFVVSGHLHPSVMIAEKPGIKKEIYKCFLEGESRGKTFIVLPSFLDFTEGTLVNDYDEDYLESFSIIPKKDIMKFRVHVIGEDGIYEFGRVRDLI